MPGKPPGDIAYFEVPAPSVVPVVPVLPLAPVVPEVEEPVADELPEAPDVSVDGEPGLGIVELLEPLGLVVVAPLEPEP